MNIVESTHAQKNFIDPTRILNFTVKYIAVFCI